MKSISKQAAQVEIVNELGTKASGKIPVAFVRSYDVSRVRMDESFLPGDRVKAKIVSEEMTEKIGKERQIWTLSTAEEELGVVFAFSAITSKLWEVRVIDQVMVPLNWETYICPVSKFKEARKVAKP